MASIFDKNGRFDLSLFEPQLLRQTNNLQTVVAAAARTHSPRIESTHFLLALNSIPNGFTRQFFRELGQGRITPSELEKGLLACAHSDADGPTPAQLHRDTLDISGRGLVKFLELNQGIFTQVNEAWLLLAVLENLATAVAETFAIVQIIPSTLVAELKQKLDLSKRYTPPALFRDGKVDMDVLTSGGQRVLELMKTEAESLGYGEMDPRHLLLGLLEFAGGAAQIGLLQQDATPQKVQERVMVNLRSRAQQNRSQLDWQLQGISLTLRSVLKQAVVEAANDYAPQIAEVHLWRAFLNQETFALRLLLDSGVDLVLVQAAARQFRPEDEPVSTEATKKKSWETIVADLRHALVGQSEVVEICLPFIRRMLFDFRRPGKPAGVFLFCGPSGVGKTEMAKAIARAVFGSEENLIMLEMGQFQTKESMNIFVGAPPGYIGYGEGKLTNGLRDKPRSVVLFDEVEKAHPQVFDALLRFIDEGQIDDPAGPIRDGSACIIIMTSNVHTEGLGQLAETGDYQKNKWTIRRKLRDALLNLPAERRGDASERELFRFRPEFLNRIDEIILFRGLTEDDLTEITRRYLLEYQARLREEKGIHITYSPNLDADARLVGQFCAALSEGARATLRVIHTAVLDPVIDFVHSQNCSFPVHLEVHLISEKERGEPHGRVRLS